MEYFIAKEASQDLDEILDYFLVRNINAGERFILQFNKKCQNIAQFQNIGRSYVKNVAKSEPLRATSKEETCLVILPCPPASRASLLLICLIFTIAHALPVSQ
ncbi:MAG: type II toxin-antitoxin system RelE/ParE family toxin [Nostoc sp.]